MWLLRTEFTFHAGLRAPNIQVIHSLRDLARGAALKRTSQIHFQITYHNRLSLKKIILSRPLSTYRIILSKGASECPACKVRRTKFLLLPLVPI